MSNDFESFRSHLGCFFIRNKVSYIGKSVLNPNRRFIDRFPYLWNILSKARVHTLDVNSEEHLLLCWDSRYGETCNWLIDRGRYRNHSSGLGMTHTMFLEGLGGIKESYFGPDQTIIDGVHYNCALTSNQNFMFNSSECKIGLGRWQLFYEDRCLFDDKAAMDTSSLVLFALEANGNSALYERQTEQILLFAHDHNFNFIAPLPNQPEFTFYTINGAPTFTDYVELLARQWLEWVV
jgi:hypothetical protein